MSKAREFRFASRITLPVRWAALAVFAIQGLADGPHTTKAFSGVKVNGGP